MSRTFLAIALGATVAGSAAGQAAPHPRPDTSWLSSRINGAALIRVSGSWGTRYLVQPQLSGRSFAYAAIEPDSLTAPLMLDSIERIQVRGNAAGKGALIGAGIGFVGGLASMTAMTSALCHDGLGCSNEGGGTAMVTLATTVGGALLGALIGSVTKRWVTVYPEDTRAGSGLP